MNKILLSAVIVLAFAGFLWFQRDSDDTATGTPTPSTSASVSPSASPIGSASPTTSPQATKTSTPTLQATLRTFTVLGNNFTFSTSEIRVKKGDRVRIVFQNTVGVHDWVIDEFNAKTPRIESGQSATVEFIANKTGTFEYYCSVGTHRAQGMKGNLIVE